jgi:hypothetical protein
MDNNQGHHVKEGVPAWTSSQKSHFAKVKNRKKMMYNMKKQLGLLGLAAFALLAFSPSPVRAALAWDFTFSGTGYYGYVQASGAITTTDTAVPLTGDIWGADVRSLTGYRITGISGEINGSPITGLVENSSFPGQTLSYDYGYIWDNALIAGTPPQFDVSGLLFATGNGNSWYYLAANNTPDGGGYSYAANSDWHAMPVNLTLTAVPEPTTMVAGALLLLPLGVSTIRILRKNHAA